MIAAIVIASWFLAFSLFVAFVHAKKLIDSGTRLSLFWRVNLYPMFALFLLLDVAFNLVVGTLLYLETPREWLFTTRCRRHVVKDDWRGAVAKFWRKQLNQVDPHHI